MDGDAGPAKILVIEDDEGLNLQIQRILKREGVQVEGAFTGAEALSLAASQPKMILLIDYNLPDMDGRELIKRLEEKACLGPFIVITGYGNEKLAVEMMKRGARDYVMKEAGFLELLPQVVRHLLNELEQEGKLREAEEALRASERLLRQIAENYPDDYISVIKKDLSVGFTAGREFKRLKMDPDSFVGLSLEDVFGVYGPEVLKTVRKNYLRTFKGLETSFELFINDQHQLYRTAPLPDEDGRISRIVAVVENITEQKEHEQELLNVITNTSHLINTPFTIALGLIDMVKNDLKEMTPEVLDTIHEKLKEIRNLVSKEMIRNVHRLTVPTSDGWTPMEEDENTQ